MGDVHDKVLVGFSQRRLIRRGRHVLEAGDGRVELRAGAGTSHCLFPPK
jgi:hypothetical protein